MTSKTIFKSMDLSGPVQYERERKSCAVKTYPLSDDDEDPAKSFKID